MKQFILDNIKNIHGWKTKRKIVILSVDDYGNVRLDSKKSRENLDKAGLKVFNRFDAYDTLETKEDLEALYNVLSSVKDKNERHAVFTPFALPCNINFEAMAEEGYKRYVDELLPNTYSKLANIDPKAYENTWELWREGIAEGLMKPQFHGREHFNLRVFEEKLKKNDKELMVNLKNRSYTSISSSGFSTIGYTAAFEFFNIEENKIFEHITKDGLKKFEEVYGYPAIHFNPPGGREHPIIHSFLKEAGIKYLDTPLIKNEHQGKGKYKKVFNWTGKRNKERQIFQVRNVVFEPTHGTINHVEKAFEQIKAAFFWHKPAIISSHRVNFCGHIDEKNRKKGLDSLSSLLSKIVNEWPDVEFMASSELGELIELDFQSQDV